MALGKTWNGMEWIGMEWNGMVWNGMDWNGMELYQEHFSSPEPMAHKVSL